MRKLILLSGIFISIIICSSFTYSLGQISYLNNHQIPKFTSYSKSFLHSSSRYGNIYRYQLQIHAYKKVFSLDLRSQSYIFHPNIILDFNISALTKFDRSQLVSGSVQSRPETQAYGYVYNSGQFQGIFTLDQVKYFIEDAKFYPSLANITHRFIIYRNIDISPRFRPKRAILSGIKCLSDPVETPSSLHELLINKRQIKTRQAITSNRIKTTCLARIDLDQHIIQRYGSQFQALVGISVLLKGANEIFRQTDFNGDGKADGIGFAVEIMSTKTNFSRLDSISNPVYYFNNWTAYYNYSRYCMGFLITDHQFDMQVTGIASSGYKIDEGICTKYHYEDNKVLSSSNAGILSVSRFSKSLIYPIREMIMAHEIGHIFGSDHDNATKLCSPRGLKGNYIMYPSVSSGKKRNDYLFSPCSRQSIYHAIVTKGWNQHTGCLINQYYPLCGNGIIDEGEECDCGYKRNCKDPCCTPAYQSFLDMTTAVPCQKIKGCNQKRLPAVIYVMAGLIGAVILIVTTVMFWKQCIRKEFKLYHNALLDSDL